MTKYIPQFGELCALLGVRKDELQRSGLVQVPAQILLALIKASVAGLPIDVEFYKQANPDIDKAFRNKPKEVVEKHFKETGYFEDRKLPLRVDVEYYGRRYGDLAEALKKGEIADLRVHFYEVGIFEKRVPSAEAESDMKTWEQFRRTYGPRGTVANAGVWGEESGDGVSHRKGLHRIE
jgi:hypothetical protein